MNFSYQKKKAIAGMTGDGSCAERLFYSGNRTRPPGATTRERAATTGGQRIQPE